MKTLVRHIPSLAWLSDGYLSAKRPDEAADVALRALALAHEHEEHGHEAWVLRALGDVASAGGSEKCEAAEDYYRRALILADERGMRPLVAHCHFDLGKLYARRGDRSSARVEIATAAALFREMNMRKWLDESERLLGSD